MTGYIGLPPQSRIIPVTKGTDVSFTLRRRDADGNLVDWDAEVFVNVDLKDGPRRVDAEVSGADAVVRIESEIANLVSLGHTVTTWQAVVSIPGNPSLEKPLCVGSFERFDGKAAS
ncbi:hypothetical protein PP713_08695 [Mycobacterium sp. CSUR Q5927]|nr:hypothetical protein [Mycobacterium sp. CSUR Q5927]